MNQDELDALIKEGKTTDEILSIRGESAEELLSEKRSVVIPTDVIEGVLLDEYSHPKLVGLLLTILNFSRGNYDYTPSEEKPAEKLTEMPAENIPNSVRLNLKNFIFDNNDKYLLAHIKQSVKGAQGGRPKKGKRPKPTAFNDNPQQATETHGFQEIPVPAEETPENKATETHGLPRKALNVNANVNVNADVCFSSKDNKGVGEEEKSPYLAQQSQETPAEETQTPLEQPQQSQPAEQSPLATPQPAAQPLPWEVPQTPVVPQVKFPVRPQSPLATPQETPAEQTPLDNPQQMQQPQPVEQSFPQQMAQQNQPQQINLFGVNPAYLQGESELPF